MTISQRYLVYISYIGTCFRGSQVQASLEYDTVQGTIKKALDSLSSYEVYQNFSSYPFFASRTDSGVHAVKAAFHFDLPVVNGFNLYPIQIQKHLNRYFTKKKIFINVLEVLKVPDIFNARFSAIEKTYLYRIGVGKESFSNCKSYYGFEILHELDRTFFLRSDNFDVQKAKETVQLFVGEKDFKAFEGKPSQSKKNSICKINSFTLQKVQPSGVEFEANSQQYDYYHFVCKGNKFLRYMVRRMVGASIAVGENIITLDEAKVLIENPVPGSWSTKILVPPGYGLYLMNINFNPEHLVLSDEEKINKLENSIDKNFTTPDFEKKTVSHMSSTDNKKNIHFRQ